MNNLFLHSSKNTFITIVNSITSSRSTADKYRKNHNQEDGPHIMDESTQAVLLSDDPRSPSASRRSPIHSPAEPSRMSHQDPRSPHPQIVRTPLSFQHTFIQVEPYTIIDPRSPMDGRTPLKQTMEIIRDGADICEAKVETIESIEYSKDKIEPVLLIEESISASSTALKTIMEDFSQEILIPAKKDLPVPKKRKNRKDSISISPPPLKKSLSEPASENYNSPYKTVHSPKIGRAPLSPLTARSINSRYTVYTPPARGNGIDYRDEGILG